MKKSDGGDAVATNLLRGGSDPRPLNKKAARALREHNIPLNCSNEPATLVNPPGFFFNLVLITWPGQVNQIEKPATLGNPKSHLNKPS